MSDIIERLHAATSSEPTVDEALRSPWLYAEAAAEITRLRAERDALAKENAALRTLLVETLPHIHGNVAEWRMLLNRPGMSPDAYATANERINSGDALLARIDAAVKS